MINRIAHVETEIARLTGERARVQAQIDKNEQWAVKLRHYIEISRLYKEGRSAEITAHIESEELKS